MSAKAQKPTKPANPENEIDVQKLWEKYEEVAMHFNGLLMQLRSRSLAFIVAISALVGIFIKQGENSFISQPHLLGGVFIVLAIVWFAIFCLDFHYYNKLLTGAVKALLELECKTKKKISVDEINLSTHVENAFSTKDNILARSFGGVIAFYCIVGGVLAALSGFFFYQAP